jgi:hypothetical protein
MGMSVQTFREISITCDRIGCAAYYAATWIKSVDTALNQAREEGWWIALNISADDRVEADNPPAKPLTFCLDHSPDSTGPDSQPDDPDGNASYCDYDDSLTEADRMGCFDDEP